MKTLIVVAHADDETIAASRWMAMAPQQFTILHTTDSGPRNPKYFQRAGFATRDAYAMHRRTELLAALKFVGIDESQCHMAQVPDQEAIMNVPLLSKTIASFFPVDRIITHSYEGGHPDHDATALAVALAVGCSGLEVLEFPAYHAAVDGTLVASQFLPHPTHPLIQRITLDPADAARKAAMFDCFRSQQHLFSRFSTTEELFRRAPEYDFLAPPHAGTLYYETRDMGMNYEMWRQFAQAVLSSKK